MVSLLLPRKTVGFETPAITTAASDSDTDSDSDEDGSKAMLKKALKLTTRHRMRKLIGDAVQLDRRNTLAFQGIAEDRQNQKNRRLAKIKGLGRQELNIPRMADLVKIKSDEPAIKFRRIARAVLLLIQVCNVCKDMLSSHVRKEPWFALVDNLIAKSTMQQKSKAPRAFVTFVPNERRELVQLTFDVAEFKRERRTEFILTDEIREMMRMLPGYRTPQQVAAIITVLKALFTFFSHYKLVTQKAIAQNAFYDKYRANRVIVKKGHHPDGIYFILSGCVVEKHEGGKQPKIINAGEKFGEGDLQCGARRRHTVLTKVDTEIFYLHKQDYRVIFDLAEDRNNPKNLDICRQHVVFQHFPMQRLVENPGTWSVHNYKYGQLIALDGNNLDWIYVIKSGEARVFKYLQPNNIDVKARRRKVQAFINSQSPFYRKKRILNFVEEREYIKSAYHPATYRPSTGISRLTAHSAPPSTLRRHKSPLLSRSCVSLPSTRQEQRRSSARKSFTFAAPEKTEIALPRLVLDDQPCDSQRNSDTKDSHVNDKADAPVANPPVVQETLVELPEETSTRSQATSCSLPEGLNTATSTSSLHVRDGGDTPSADAREGKEHRGEHSSSNKLGADLPGKRAAERRVSADLTGSLFEKSMVGGSGGEPGRRLSIMLPPPPEVPENGVQRRPSILVKGDPAARAGSRARGRSASFLKTPGPSTARSLTPGHAAAAGGKDKVNQVIQVGNHTLPAFVQVETLHPGQVFGLRACLDAEERGPSVSLVSGDCEVLQINKKFFMRHCDDAIYSLIRLKNKPFPSEEDLIDRLDVNMQWEDYKQQTMHSFLKECRSAKR